MSNLALFTAKAESGDSAAMVDLGLLYLEGKEVESDIKKTIHWWEKAANAGNENAIHNLTGMYADPHSGEANSEACLKWLKKLAYDVKDGKAMVILGTIFMGSPHGHMMWRRAFEVDAFAAYRNSDEGFRLIEEGLRLAEAGKTSLDRFDYDAIASAYYFRNGGFAGSTVPDLEKALKYREKALSLIPSNRHDLREVTQKSVDDLKRALADRRRGL